MLWMFTERDMEMFLILLSPSLKRRGWLWVSSVMLAVADIFVVVYCQMRIQLTDA
jgi:hypothetical protein